MCRWGLGVGRGWCWVGELMECVREEDAADVARECCVATMGDVGCLRPCKGGGGGGGTWDDPKCPGPAAIPPAGGRCCWCWCWCWCCCCALACACASCCCCSCCCFWCSCWRRLCSAAFAFCFASSLARSCTQGKQGKQCVCMCVHVRVCQELEAQQNKTKTKNQHINPSNKQKESQLKHKPRLPNCVPL